MRITREQIIDNNNLVGHMILEAFGRNTDIMEALADKQYADVELTINGKHVLDIESFVNHWQRQVADMIDEKARDLLRSKYSNIAGGLDEIMENVDALAREERERPRPMDTHVWQPSTNKT